MLTRVIAWYARRIVNVNINICVAGVLALVPVCGAVKLAEHLMATRRFANGALQERLETHHQLIITGVTFFTDIICDVAIYFVLHWLANHTPRLAALRRRQIEGVADAAAENVPFFKDAAKVQLQRAVLSPLLYFLWLGSQFVFMNLLGWWAVPATVGGFCIAMGTVRSIHTFWMLRDERRARARAFVAGIPLRCADGPPDPGTPPAIPGPDREHTRGRNGSPPAPAHGGADQSLSENGLKSVSRSK